MGVALKAGFYYEQAYGAASERMHSEMDIAYSEFLQD
ncbi:hypothetical protein SAMN04488047_12738 [Tranquillimonas alkanivorans]|uniref:Uncharacterized protein n=1 Tax=Tranquillimonas alkanivorans TaxID=441119 RepID=A0A1I5V6A4_9RHOB|nr:hypothetical protein SAMN04488047_12738 [Tranquillimonas alkanivorans]